MTNEIKKDLSEVFGFFPNDESFLKLSEWKKLFIEYNSHTNLMSKNDIPLLYKKHVVDSLSIVLFKGFEKADSLLDVGCGGGFPSVILSIFFPDLQVYAMDSTSKKIKFLELVKNELKLQNLYPIASRCETHPSLFVDILTNRAVGKIADVYKFSKNHLKKNGYFISYKSHSAKEEAKEASKSFPELIKPEFISYNLPLEENFTRELVIFKKH